MCKPTNQDTLLGRRLLLLFIQRRGRLPALRIH